MPSHTQAHIKHARGDDLSARERDVILLLRHGLTDEAIAAELGISAITVRHHMATIRDKLGCHNRAQVLSLAQAQGLL